MFFKIVLVMKSLAEDESIPCLQTSEKKKSKLFSGHEHLQALYFFREYVECIHKKELVNVSIRWRQLLYFVGEKHFSERVE